MISRAVRAAKIVPGDGIASLAAAFDWLRQPAVDVLIGRSADVPRWHRGGLDHLLK